MAFPETASSHGLPIQPPVGESENNHDVVAALRQLYDMNAAAKDAIDWRLPTEHPAALLLQLSNIAYGVMDYHSGRWRYLSDSAQEMLGYPIEHWLEGGLGFGPSISHPEDQQLMNGPLLQMRTAIQQLTDGCLPSVEAEMQYRLRHAEGYYLWVQQRSIPLHSENGRLTLGFEMIQDITSLKADEVVIVRGTYHIHGRVVSLVDYASNQAMLRQFTPREQETLVLLAQGYTSKEIGQRFGVGESTVVTYRKALMRKTETRNIAGLLDFARRKALV